MSETKLITTVNDRTTGGVWAYMVIAGDWDPLRYDAELDAVIVPQIDGLDVYYVAAFAYACPEGYGCNAQTKEDGGKAICPRCVKLWRTAEMIVAMSPTPFVVFPGRVDKEVRGRARRV